MVKKVFTLMTSMVFVLGLSGLALAQNTATANQSSADNDVLITQVGANNTIDLDQVATISNDATLNQSGDNNVLGIEQTGTKFESPATNQAKATQTGTGNTANAKQVTGGGTNAILSPSPGIIQNGTGNYLGGADGSAVFYTHVGPAYQSNAAAVNTLRANQQGDFNRIGLKQTTNGDNSADIDQLNGDNELVVYQSGSIAGSSNTLVAGQLGTDKALVSQSSNNGNVNTATINQDGYNFLVRANSDGSINTGSAATQNIWSGGNNTLDVIQSGQDNEAGLFQLIKGAGTNDAEITQTGGENSLGVYQEAASYNVLDVAQYGDVDAMVSQISTGSYNDCYLYQSAGSSAIVSMTATSGPNIVSITQ